MSAEHEQRSGAQAVLDEQEQGALDMLLKSHYEPVPPDGYFDAFLASVEERIEGEGLDGAAKAESAGGAPKKSPKKEPAADDDDGVIFKSSPALEALRIPEPKRTSRTTGTLSTVSAADLPPVSAPPPPSGAYRWPVAFVLAAAIGVGGFLVYKKTAEPPMTQRPMPPTLSAAGPQAAPTDPTAAKTTAGADATVVAMANKTDGGQPGSAGTSSDPGKADPAKADPNKADPSKADPSKADTKSTKGAKVARRRRHKAVRVAKADTSPKAPKKAVKGKAKKPVATAGTPAPKKNDTLDSLLDTALGKSGQAASAKPKKAEAKPEAPKSLTMNQIRASMKRINSRVGACYDKYQVEGTARVKLTITNGGKPKDIAIKGKFFGTDTGACVKKAVQAARFPKSSGKEPTITYPFRLSE